MAEPPIDVNLTPEVNLKDVFGTNDRGVVGRFIFDLFAIPIVVAGIGTADEKKGAKEVLDIVLYGLGLLFVGFGLGKEPIPTQRGGVDNDQLALPAAPEPEPEPLAELFEQIDRGIDNFGPHLPLERQRELMNLAKRGVREAEKAQMAAFAKARRRHASSKSHYMCLVDAIVCLLIGVLFCMNEITSIALPMVISAETALVKTSLGTGSVVALGATGLEYGATAAAAGLQQFDALAMAALKGTGEAAAAASTSAVLTTQTIATAFTNLLSNVGSLTTNTREGRKLSDADKKNSTDMVSLLMNVEFESDLLALRKAEVIKNISGQVQSAVQAKLKGTQPVDMDIDAFIRTYRDKREAELQKKISEFKGFGVFDLRPEYWMLVFQERVKLYTAQNIAQGHIYAFHVLSLLAKNPAASSFLMLKLALSAIAGVAILPPLRGVMRDAAVRGELDIEAREAGAHLEMAQRRLVQVLRALENGAAAVGAPPAGAPPAGQGGRRRRTRRNRHRRHRPSAPTRKGLSYSRRLRGSTGRRRG